MKNNAAVIEEIETNGDKIFWPSDGYTKDDMLQYYAKIAPYMLPHLKDRPIVLNRFPNGIDGENFFQKQSPQFIPDWMRTTKIKHTNKSINYLLIDDIKSLLYVANLASIEINSFLSTYKNLDCPEILVLDLDPVDLPFQAVVEVAKISHLFLKKHSMEHFCKTSGKRGLHIYIPLQARYTYAQVADFAELLARLIAEPYPDLISLIRDPKKRQKKVYIDFLQNSKTKTMAAAYSLRPVEHALVSTPLEWDELNAKLEPSQFDIQTVPKRVVKKGDLFKPLLKAKGIDIETFLERMS